VIGKLIGKAVGEIIALPWTVGSEINKAGAEAVKQTEKAVERAEKE
jgi:hypothetical protein